MSTITQDSAINAELQLYNLTNDALIGGPAAACILGIGSTTFDRLVRTGQLPAPVKIPDTRAQRWRTGDVRAWVRAQSAKQDVAA